LLEGLAFRQHPATEERGRRMRSQLSKPMVIRTKLRPPARRGGLVPRPELVARLCDTRRYRLATIQAAAGFGKTSLLSQCYERIRGAQPAAWLSLDASDNDYLRFLAHLFATIEASGVEPGREFKYLVRFGSRLAPSTCADLLTRALDSTRCGLTICVDDFHVLNDAPSAQLLSHLLLAPRSSLSWLLASRTALTSLPLNRLRLLNELLEIDTQALKFSNAESHEFLCSAVGEALEPTLSRLLTERTEGWVAGLQLASLGLRAAGSRAELIHGFTGANRNVADFLRDTVLSNLDAGTQDFLLATSLLPRLSVELCNFVTGQNDARPRLDLLEALNLFIFSLDDERRWYRYHHLFAEFLEQRLCDREPVRARQLQQRASVWFEESGCTLEAIELALRAQAYERAARLLDVLGLFDKGEAGPLEHLARRIPKSVLEQFPNLELERIYAWEADWNFTRSRSGLNRLKRVLHEWRSGRKPVPEHVDLDYIAAKIAHREMMVLFVSDDMAGTRKACEEWLAARHCADPHMQISTAGALLAARREHYDCAGIEATAAALHEQYQRAQWTFGEIFQDCISGLVFFQVGNATRARETYGRSLAAAVLLHGKLSPLASMPALLLAEVHYEQNRLWQARALIVDYLHIAHGLGYVDKLIAGYLTKARLEASDGQYEIAQQTLDEGDRCARVTGFIRLQANVLCERMRQLLLSGNSAAVIDLARQAGLLGSCATLQPRDGVTSVTEQLAICWAYAARANGDVDGAIRLLKNWYRFVMQRRCHRSGLRLALELATLFYLRDDLSAARHQVCEAIHISAPHHWVRSFIDAGRAIRHLLQGLVSEEALAEAESQYAQELLRGFTEEKSWIEPAHQAASGCVSVGEFSHREVDILELAAGDVPNREIARRLVLSEHTVKWYWKQIFGKLNVHRRLQAVISARAAGLIH
jgi:LuxR family transcriptional regulator, maltose regulon positive regulatory protein